MAVTLISGVNGVGFTANPHVWSFSTNNTDPTTRIAIQVLIEKEPYTDTWDFVGEYVQLVGASGSCKFHLEDKLKAYLSWDVPTFFDQGVSVAPNICRRYKLRWGEYTSSDMVLAGTWYQTTGSSVWYDLPITLTSGAKYRLVAESKDITTLNAAVAIDQDASVATTLDLDDWHLEHDRASYYLTPGATYTAEDIRIPTGISIRLYSAAINWSAYTDPADRAVLLGGISFERFGKPLGPPSAATLLSVTPSGESVINGTFVDQTGGTAQHEVWYSEISATENFQLLETLVAGDNTFSNTGLSGGTTRWYKVRPVNASATGLFGNVATATTLDLSNALKITVKTDNAGTSGTNQFTIPTLSPAVGFDYAFDVYYNNAIVASVNNSNWNTANTITFPDGAGTKQIAIVGVCDGWNFNFGGDKDKLLSVERWGILRKFANTGFALCTNLDLTTVVDIPDLSADTNLTNCFNGCTSLTDINNLEDWNVSSITLMQQTFQNCTSFVSTRNLNSWDVSNVTLMRGLFDNSEFNGNISDWNVGLVTDFRNMFEDNDLFNQDISGWNMISATTLQAMFRRATAFNQDISGWAISGLLASGLEGIFNGATAFDQDISGWDVASVTDFRNVFKGAMAFNQDLFTGTPGLDAWDWTVTRAGGAFIATNCFDNCGISTANYDAMLQALDAVDLVDNVTLGAAGLNYTAGGAAEAARTSIITNDSWTITDGGAV